VWYPSQIIEMISHQLQASDAELRQQHAYHGLDALSETQLHPLLAQAFTATPHGASREVGYPSSPLERPNDAQRQRCDLVLTPIKQQLLIDPVQEQRAQDQALGTLFESMAEDFLPNPDSTPPESAYWIEVKSIAQFSYVDGIPGPNSKYTSDLLVGPRDDVIKLASDPLIHHGAALVILFCEDENIGTHDMAALTTELINQDLPVALPDIESFPITNHAGNGWCTLGLIPIKL
jgi:hypothetical protein